MDNVGHLNPKPLVEVNRLIVESGHAVAAERPGVPLRGRRYPFVAETDVHYPTDISLLWGAMRCLVRETVLNPGLFRRRVPRLYRIAPVIFDRFGQACFRGIPVPVGFFTGLGQGRECRREPAADDAPAVFA